MLCGKVEPMNRAPRKGLGWKKDARCQLGICMLLCEVSYLEFLKELVMLCNCFRGLKWLGFLASPLLLLYATQDKYEMNRKSRLRP